MICIYVETDFVYNIIYIYIYIYIYMFPNQKAIGI